jgi:hypothetical protein
MCGDPSDAHFIEEPNGTGGLGRRGSRKNGGCAGLPRVLEARGGHLESTLEAEAWSKTRSRHGTSHLGVGGNVLVCSGRWGLEGGRETGSESQAAGWRGKNAASLVEAQEDSREPEPQSHLSRASCLQEGSGP